MKKLELKNPSFQYVENSFREWLDILGYSPSTVYNLPTHIKEFLHWCEQENITGIPQIKAEHIRRYYTKTKNRANDRRGGGLSNGHLNKHLQALYKFAAYLRQSGRSEFPLPGIEWETNDTETI